MKRKSIGFVLLIAGFLAGYQVSRFSRNSSLESGRNETAQETRRGTRSAEVTGSAPGDPAASSAPIGSLLDKAFSERSEIRATRLLMDALSQHRKESADVFAAYFSSIPFSKSHFNHWRLFFSSWGTFDGPAALAYIQKRFDQAALQREFYYSVMKSWNHGLPRDALDGAGEFLLSTPGPVGDLATEYVRDLLASDPDKAIMQMVRLSDPESVMEMAGEKIASLARKDVHAALKWLDSVKGDSKSFLTGRVLATWSGADPVGAATWLARQGYPMISVNDLGAIAANYVKTDVTAAFEWIHSLPDSHFSAQVLETTTTAWTKNDPVGATKWLANHNPASEYDPVVTAIVRTIARGNPAEALEASSKIHDAAKAQETFFQVAMDWKEKQPVDFMNWLQDSNLITSEQKIRLQNREFHAAAMSGGNPAPVVREATTDGRE